MQIKNTMSYHFPSTRMAKIAKITSTGKNVKKLEPQIFLLAGTVCYSFGNQFGTSLKCETYS
jgi:hypothetical protein